jgi:hypothetical protein
MKRVPVLLSLFAALLASAGRAREIADIELPESMQGGGVELVLNGAGVRTRFFVDVYVGGLYLTQASRDAAAIVAADEPMAIKLHIITRLITAERMKKSIEAGFELSTAGDTAPIRKQIDSLMGVYDDGVADEDVFDIVYVPGKGLDVFKNGTYRATVESGLRFKRALFGIWFSDRPIQASLKRGMLGR